MPKKSTSHLENELKRSESLEAFLDNNQDELSREELPELLQVLADSRGMTKADIVKASNLNEIYAYQILSGARRPSRDKLIQLCFGMRMNEVEACELLERGGASALRPYDRRDVIVAFCLNRQLEVSACDDLLWGLGEETFTGVSSIRR